MVTQLSERGFFPVCVPTSGMQARSRYRTCLMRVAMFFSRHRTFGIPAPRTALRASPAAETKTKICDAMRCERGRSPLGCCRRRAGCNGTGPKSGVQQRRLLCMLRNTCTYIDCAELDKYASAIHQSSAWRGCDHLSACDSVPHREHIFFWRATQCSLLLASGISPTSL